MDASFVAFGSFQFDIEHQVLFHDDAPVRLSRPGSSLLSVLLRHRGEIVSKDDLIHAAWPGQAVEESNLSVQIAQLRAQLGRCADGRPWVETIQRVGYRFAPQRAVSSAIALSRSLPKVAVLVSNAQIGSIAEEAIENIASALVRFSANKVLISTSHSALRNRKNAERQGANYLLEVVIRGELHAERLHIRLLEAASGTVLFMGQFEVALAGQSAGAIAAITASEVQSAEIRKSLLHCRESASAYDSYLRGRFRLLSSRQDDNAAAYAHMLEAVSLEPENPAYLSGLIEAMHHRAAVGWELFGAGHKQQTRELITRCLDLPGADATALALVGVAMFPVDEEDRGLATVRRALAMNGNSPLVLVCAGLTELWAGSLDEAERLFKKAISLAPSDPNQRFAAEGLTTLYRIRGDAKQSLEWADWGSAISSGLSGVHWGLITANQSLGRHLQSERQLARYMEVANTATVKGIAAGQHYRDSSRLTPLLEELARSGMPSA
jgi:DNA-binding winged helix-turn-helix (wHTH) protein